MNRAVLTRSRSESSCIVYITYKRLSIQLSSEEQKSQLTIYNNTVGFNVYTHPYKGNVVIKYDFMYIYYGIRKIHATLTKSFNYLKLLQ